MREEDGVVPGESKGTRPDGERRVAGGDGVHCGRRYGWSTTVGRTWVIVRTVCPWDAVEDEGDDDWY